MMQSVARCLSAGQGSVFAREIVAYAFLAAACFVGAVVTWALDVGERRCNTGLALFLTLALAYTLFQLVLFWREMRLDARVRQGTGVLAVDESLETRQAAVVHEHSSNQAAHALVLALLVTFIFPSAGFASRLAVFALCCLPGVLSAVLDACGPLLLGWSASRSGGRRGGGQRRAEDVPMVSAPVASQPADEPDSDPETDAQEDCKIYLSQPLDLPAATSRDDDDDGPRRSPPQPLSRAEIQSAWLAGLCHVLIVWFGGAASIAVGAALLADVHVVIVPVHCRQHVWVEMSNASVTHPPITVHTLGWVGTEECGFTDAHPTHETGPVAAFVDFARGRDLLARTLSVVLQSPACPPERVGIEHNGSVTIEMTPWSNNFCSLSALPYTLDYTSRCNSGGDALVSDLENRPMPGCDDRPPGPERPDMRVLPPAVSIPLVALEFVVWAACVRASLRQAQLHSVD